MPRPNFYMSEKDKTTLLSMIRNYLDMWADADSEILDGLKEEFKEINGVGNKIRNMHKSKSYNSAIIKEALEIANRLEEEGKMYINLWISLKG